MLTQKMSKEIMLVANGIDVDANLANLQKTHDLFDKTLMGLKKGDADLGLQATKSKRTLKGLSAVDALWAKFSPLVKGVISSKAVDAATVAAVADQNVPLLKAMNRVVKLYEAQTSASGGNAAKAVAINLAGRQRMLTQKMSKEFLLIAYGHQADVYKTELKKTHDLFDTTLTGLIAGDAATGLSPAPAAVKPQLEVVKGLWAGFNGPIAAAAGGSAIADADKTSVATKNLPLLKEMNKAVGLFEKL